MLYDGLCGFCDQTVRLALRARGGTIRFAPLQGSFADSVLERHEPLRGIDSLVLVEPAYGQRKERLYVKSGAVLRLAFHLGGVWRVLAVLYLVPRPFLDRAYDAFACHRHRILGRLDACLIPGPEVRSRFLC